MSDLPAAPSAPASRTLLVHSVTLVGFLMASGAPTPLYRLYQDHWSFSPMLLTVIFGVYALALLSSLVIAGALSDHIGRRPVISLALVLEIGAMALFLAAAGPGWLIAARLLQGVATGLATSALGAALIDLDRDRGALTNSLAPMSGLALGALGTTALTQLAPLPLHLVFFILLALFAIQLGLTWRTPETSPGRPGVMRSLVPSISVPKAARAELLAVTPINCALWALGGFYLSLMPSLIARVTGSSSAWLGGLSVAALTLSGAGAILLVRRRSPTGVLLFGSVLLLIGIPLILAGADAGYPVVLVLGSVTAGVGFGAGFLGAVRRLMPLAAPNERAGLMAAFYVESYLAHALPAMLAGALARDLDLLTVANLYGGILVLLVAASVAFTLARHRMSGCLAEERLP